MLFIDLHLTTCYKSKFLRPMYIATIAVVFPNIATHTLMKPCLGLHTNRLIINLFSLSRWFVFCRLRKKPGYLHTCVVKKHIVMIRHMNNARKYTTHNISLLLCLYSIIFHCLCLFSR